jgi:glutamate synthase (NADPH) small chain
MDRPRAAPKPGAEAEAPGHPKNMHNDSIPGRNPKYAWRDVARAETPKREVGDRISDFRATYRPYDAATASEQAGRCIQCPNPSCVEVCPIDTPIPELMRLTADRQFKEAAELLFSSSIIPELFVHICAGERLCEAVCALADKSEPVPVSFIGRFLLDYGWNHGIFESPIEAPTGRSVAVVGSGLCGLVAADELSRRGHSVTVFDAYHKPGGRLVNGLPGFRVDRELIEKRVGLLAQRGVKFRTGMVCGRDLRLGELRRDFDAVFFGLGRANPVRLEIPGSKLRGVRQAYPFVLRNTSDAKLETPPVSVHGRRIVVLGGGETAIDALRVAIRCGAGDVVCIYRRDRSDMPANPNEVGNAEEEGARFTFFAEATAIIGNEAGDVTHVRCVRTIPGGVDASGRHSVAAVANSEFDVPADVVLVAYGFEAPKLTQMDEFAQLKVDGRGHLVVDAKLMTNIQGVFAGGSVVRGAVPLIDVVHDARNAAVAISAYLGALQRPSPAAPAVPGSAPVP